MWRSTPCCGRAPRASGACCPRSFAAPPQALSTPASALDHSLSRNPLLPQALSTLAARATDLRLDFSPPPTPDAHLLRAGPVPRAPDKRRPSMWHSSEVSQGTLATALAVAV